MGRSRLRVGFAERPYGRASLALRGRMGHEMIGDDTFLHSGHFLAFSSQLETESSGFGMENIGSVRRMPPHHSSGVVGMRFVGGEISCRRAQLSNGL